MLTSNKLANKLSETQLEYGEGQLSDLLRDRPQMQKFVVPHDPVWNWAVRQLAGENSGKRILWSNRLPDSYWPCIAESQFPHDGKAPFIRIRQFDDQGHFIDGELLWSTFVFELFNVASKKEFDRIFADAQKGKMTKQEFIKRITMLEFDSARSRTDFYHSIWEKQAKLTHLKPTNSYWVCDAKSYDDWITRYEQAQSLHPGYSYLGRYSDLYSQETAPRLAHGNRERTSRKTTP